jgi:hypothetical protein
LHGGNTLPAVNAAVRRRLELGCAHLLKAENIEPVTDPVAELELHAGEVLAWRDLLRRRLGELEHWRWQGRYGQEELRAEVSLYERSLDRAEKTLVSMAKLGIAERRVALEERQTEAMVQIIEAALADLGYDPASADVRAVIHRHALAIEAKSGQVSRG